LRQLGSFQRRVGLHAQSQSDIDVFRQQVNRSVVHDKVELNFRMSIKERDKPRHQMRTGERDRRRDSQPAFQSRASTLWAASSASFASPMGARS
jgi:hypothetical protein